MEEYWATRTGRWRRAMQGRTGPSFAERLFDVIVADMRAGALPAGAVLPSAERVAAELIIPADDVRSAFVRLLAEDVIAGAATACCASRRPMARMRRWAMRRRSVS